MKRHVMCQTVGIALAAVAVLAGQVRGNKAYLFIGDVGDSTYNRRVSIATAAEAESDYSDAGYTVVRNDSAVAQDFRDALADPDAMALWFFGHGDKGGRERLDFTDVEVAGVDVTGPYPGIMDVTLHSCGQKQQSWKDKFPNAELNAWPRGVFVWQAYWWQFGAGYTPLNQHTSLVPPVPNVHPRLEPGEQVRNDGEVICDWESGVTGNFSLDESLQAFLDNQA